MSCDAEMPGGYRLVTLDEIDSTNSEALRLAARGTPSGLLVTAQSQTRGRGRSGRAWQPIPGNLYASLMLRLSCAPMVAQQLALVAGVAVVDAIRSGAAWSEPARQLRLKWPNDVLAGTAKLGGILLESAQDLGGPGLVTVIGIGLNVAGAPQDLGREATSLAAVGIGLDRKEVLTSIARSMDSALSVWNEGTGFAAIRAAWLDRSGPQGERLSINTGTGAVAGRYLGLDDDGALLLLDDVGVRHRFTYGDVSLAGTGAAL